MGVESNTRSVRRRAALRGLAAFSGLAVTALVAAHLVSSLRTEVARRGEEGVVSVTQGGPEPAGDARLSILARASTDADRLPAIAAPYAHAFSEPGAPRLVLDSGGRQLYVGLSRTRGEICTLLVNGVSHSVGLACTPLETLSKFGAQVIGMQTPTGQLVAGIVADHVTGVDIDGGKVQMGTNGFFVELPADSSAPLLVRSAAGTREVSLRPPGDRPEDEARPSGT